MVAHTNDFSVNVKKVLSKRLKIKFLDVGNFGQGGAGEKLLIAILNRFNSYYNATVH